MSRGAWLGLAIAALAVAASITGLHNGFVYDDQAIIVGNPHVHTLAGLAHRFIEPYWPADRGSGLYRPLTIVLFALQWAQGGGTPWIFHFVNLILYAGLSVAVFGLARQILPEVAAVVAAALFAVHPVHVEAVANGVGQSELTAALAVVIAVMLYLKWRQARPAEPLGTSRLLVLCLLYLVACGCKEHGVVLPALLLLAELTLVGDPRTRPSRLRSLAPSFCVLAVVGVSYLAFRSWVLRDVPEDIQALSFLPLSAAQRIMTGLALVPDWLRLLFWPAHLQADYSPLETAVVTTFQPIVAVSAILLGAVAAAVILVKRQWPPGAFGAGWIAIALLPASNLLVASGQVLAERTMMLPSVGAVLVLGGMAALAMARAGAIRERRLVGAVPAVLVLAGLIRSAGRQPVWATDAGLRVQTVLDAPRSYWAQWIYGDWLFTHGKPADGERYMRRAVELYAGNPFIMRTLAIRYQENGFCPAAAPLFAQTLRLRPLWWEVRLRLAGCLQTLGRNQAASDVIDVGIALGAGLGELQAFQSHPPSPPRPGVPTTPR